VLMAALKMSLWAAPVNAYGGSPNLLARCSTHAQSP